MTINNTVINNFEHRKATQCFWYLVLVGVLSFSIIPCGVEAETNHQVNAVKNKELRYREVLFHFFRKDYFSAINQLMVSKQLQRLPDKPHEMAMLLGSLYLAYGMLDDAEIVFNDLLKKPITTALKDLTWFYIAKMQYKKNDVASVDQALKSIKTELPLGLVPEYYYLQAYVANSQQNFVASADLLGNIKRASDWHAFGRFNYGIALINSGKRDEGLDVLDRVGDFESENDQILALQDKANVALGYLYLREKESKKAIHHLERVRLTGPFSNKALLGLGWAHSDRKQFDKALVPWLELSERDFLDATVQEAMLAAPYAFSQLNAQRQALQFYEDSIGKYQKIQQGFQSLFKRVSSGKYFAEILGEGSYDDVALSRFVRSIGHTPDGRLLQFLLSSKDFQDGFRRYRDVRQMRDNVFTWINDLGVYSAALTSQENLYRDILPRLAKKFANHGPDVLLQKASRLFAKLQHIREGNNYVALANEEEYQRLLQLARLAERLRALPASYNREPQQRRIEFLRGSIIWDITQDIENRIEKITVVLTQIKRDLNLTEEQKRLLAQLSEYLDGMDQDSQIRIQQALKRAHSMYGRLDRVVRQHEIFLQRIAIDELSTQQQHVVTYVSQVRFAIAQLQDQASTPNGKNP